MAVPTSHPVAEYPKFINGYKVYSRQQEADYVASLQKEEKKETAAPAEEQSLPSSADLDAAAAEDDAKEATAIKGKHWKKKKW